MKNYNKKEIDNDGSVIYTFKGKFHRIDGPAIEYANGTKEWYIDDKLHRTDGPAVEWADGGKAWYIDDKLHRTDGPAIEYPNGYKYWYINGEEYSEQEFRKIINPPNCPEYMKC